MSKHTVRSYILIAQSQFQLFSPNFIGNTGLQITISVLQNACYKKFVKKCIGLNIFVTFLHRPDFFIASVADAGEKQQKTLLNLNSYKSMLFYFNLCSFLINFFCFTLSIFFVSNDTFTGVQFQNTFYYTS